MGLLIKNALIVDSDYSQDLSYDILIEKKSIVRVASSITIGKHKIMDAKGKHVFPGLIDMHAHLREPGFEHKETIESGSRSAAKGGFTSVCCMPNTNPVIDNQMVIEGILKESKRVGLINIFPIGAVTKQQKGQEMTDLFELKKAGCIGISDDGYSVLDSQLLRHALDYAQMVGLLLIEHCEEPALSSCGVMNEGYTSTLLGLKGQAAMAETAIMARDIEIARYCKTKIHFAHISLERSVQLIKVAKKQGISVTCEVTPHHFTLDEEAVKNFDTNTKVNPPLRTKSDVDAIKAALKDGIIDCIATDHAPHTIEDKEAEFDHAAFGVIGFETAFALGITQLVNPGILSLVQLAEKMSGHPAAILGLSAKGRIREGFDADLILVDIDKSWQVDSDQFFSKASNSPFIGQRLFGQIEKTICNGKVVYSVE